MEDITTSDGRFVDFAGLSVMTTERHTGFPKPNITILNKKRVLRVRGDEGVTNWTLKTQMRHLDV